MRWSSRWSAFVAVGSTGLAGQCAASPTWACDEDGVPHRSAGRGHGLRRDRTGAWLRCTWPVPRRVESANDGRTYLVTTTSRRQRLAERVHADLGFVLDGVAAFRAVAPLAGCDSTHHALVEDEPVGRPSVDAITPSPSMAIGLALDVAKVAARAHAVSRVLSYLRPELIYVGDDYRLAGVVPRPEAFIVGAAPHSSGVGPLFDAIYSAPEVLALSKDPTPAADVFSLCACLGRWLSGEHAFEGDTVQTQAMAIMTGQRRTWNGPPDLGSVVGSGLAVNPDERPPLDRLIELLEAAARGS